MPSIYFIDSQSGTNIETTGGSAEKDKLLQSIEKALKDQPINTAAAVADRLVFIFLYLHLFIVVQLDQLP